MSQETAVIQSENSCNLNTLIFFFMLINLTEILWMVVNHCFLYIIDKKRSSILKKFITDLHKLLHFNWYNWILKKKKIHTKY